VSFLFNVALCCLPAFRCVVASLHHV
jgi:hypothetical protein